MVSRVSLRNCGSFFIKTTLVVFTLILFIAIFLLNPNFSFNTALAQTDLPQHFTLDGRLFEPGSNTTPLLDNNTILTIQVLNPDRDCVLYEEEQPVNTLGTNGYFSIRVGSNIGNTKRSGRDEGNSMNTVFYNTTAVINGRTQSNSNCTYDPASGDERFFRFFIKPSSASVAVQLSDDMPVNSVPQAIVAQTLQGYSPANFFRTSATSTQLKLDNLLTTEYSNITGLLDGSNPTYVRNDPAGTVFQSRSSDPSSPATGQVWFNASDNKFKYYDGTTVQDVTNGSGSAVSITAGEGLDGGTITGTGTIDISDSGVTTDKLADGSVSTAKLIDTSVTEVKLADSAVTSVKLADDSVTTAKVVNEGITTAKLADSAVTTVKINDGAVTDAKLATGIDAAKITLNTLPASVVPTGTDDTKLPLTGGTLTGKLTLGDETDYAGFDLINTGHITMNGQKTITIGRYNDTQQTSLIGTLSPVNAGALWFNTTTGKLMYWSGTQEYELSESTSAGGDITAVNTNTGSGLSGGDTSGPVTLSINVDGTTIEIATNTLRVADGGISTAKLADGAVTTDKLGDGAVTSTKLADDAVTTAKVVNEGITSAKLQDGAVTSIKINDGAVTTNKLADGAVSTVKLADTSVTEVKLANSAVTTAKLNDGAVTSVKLADGSVVTTKLADSAVTTQKLNDGAVTTIKLADDAVSTIKVQDSAITSDKIAASAIIAAKLANDAVTSGKILDATIIDADIAATAAIAWSKIDKTGASAADLGAIPDSRLINTNTGSALSGGGDLSADRSLAVNVDGSTININGSNALQVMDGGISTLKIADDAVTTAKVVNEGITTAKIADSAVTTLKLNDGAVTTNKLADGSVSTIKLADTSVTEVKLANSAVTNVKLADGSVGTTKIADSAVTTLKLNDGSVTTAKLNDGSVTTVKLANDAVTGAKILDGTITNVDIDRVNISKIASAPTEYFSYMPGGSACSDGNVLKWDNTNEHWVCDTDVSGISDHGLLSGLTDDDHTQYVMLAGRTGGQNLRGGTAANNNLTLESTSDATKGYVLIQPNGGNVGVGTTAPHESAALQVDSTTKGFLPPRMTTVQRDAIGSPVAGLVVYNTNNQALEFYNGSAWMKFNPSNVVQASASGLSATGSGTINFATKVTDVGNEFDLSTDRFTPTTAGKYLVVFSAYFEGMSDGAHFYCSILKNGANIYNTVERASIYHNQGTAGTFIVDMNGTTDYIAIGHTASTGYLVSASVQFFPLATQLAGGSGGGDDLGSHIASQNLSIVHHWLSGDGDPEGIRIAADGNVGIGTADPQSLLDVAGRIRAQEICDETGSNCKDISSGWGAGGDIDGIETNAGSALTGGAASGTATLSVVTDNTTIEVNGSNALRVKDGGIGTTKIADTSVTEVKLATGAVTTNKIADGAITSAKILDGTITSADVDVISIGKISNGPAEYFNYKPGSSACLTGQVLKWDDSNEQWLCDTDIGVTDHGLLGGLTDDDHTQYVLLAGRAAGQTVSGGVNASGNLTLDSTAHATKGYVLLQPNGGSVGVGTTTPHASAALQIDSTTQGFLPPRMTTAQRNAMASPASGVIVYDTDIDSLYVYSDSAWKKITNTEEVAFRAYKTANSTISNSTVTVVDWDGEVYDTDNAFDLSTNRFQPSKAGYYFISVSTWVDDLGVSGYVQTTLRRNGVATLKTQVVHSHSSIDPMGTLTGILYLNGSTDYVDVTVYQVSGASRTMPGDSTYNYISGFLISGGTGITGGGGTSDNLGDHIAIQNISLGNNWISGDGDSEGLRINSTGNVGIGTSNPQSLLDVAGIIRAEQICDETGGNCKDISTGWSTGVDTTRAINTNTGSGLTGGGDLSADRNIAVNVDNATVEINANALRVKDGGVGTAKLADGAITSAKILDGTITSADVDVISIGKITNGPAEYFNYKPGSSACLTGQVLKWDDSNEQWLCDTDVGVTDHGLLGGLTDDDHTQYVMLAGRAAGQTVNGGVNASGSLTLDSTAHATKGYVLLQPSGGSVGVGTTAPHASAAFQVDSTTQGFLPARMTTAQRNAISSPATGLLVYNTTTNVLESYNGSVWVPAGAGPGAAFRATLSGGAIATTSWSFLTGLTEAFDMNNNFNPATGTFTAPSAGIYSFDGSVHAVTASTNFLSGIYVNGSVNTYGTRFSATGSINPVSTVSTTVMLGAGDTVRLGIHNDAAATGVIVVFTGYKVNAGASTSGAVSDNMGNHSASQNISLNGNWLSGDGGAEGVFVTGAGNVGIGTDTPNALLDVAGIIRAEQICDETGGNCKDISTGWSTGVDTTRAINTNTGSGLTGGGDLSADRNIAVNVDNATVEINANALRVKDGGIGTTKIANGSVTSVKLAADSVTSAKILNGTITSADVDVISIGKITNGPAEYFNYKPGSSACLTGQVLKWNDSNEQWLCDTDVGVTDHGLLGGLTDDDHTQYVLLAGRAAGQTVNGGANASGNLTLDSTAHATKGYVLLQPSGGSVGVGTTTPHASAALQIDSTTQGFLPPRMTTAQRLLIASPQSGLVVFDSTEKSLYVYQNSAWSKLANSTEVAFSVAKTASQAVGTATWDKVTWETEAYDIGNSFNLTTERFQPTVAGKYYIHFSSATVGGPNTGYWHGAIAKNNVIIAYDWRSNASGLQLIAIVSAVVDMNGTTDYIEFFVNSTAASMSLHSSSQSTFAQGFLISGGTGGGGGAADHLGNHTATQNIALANNWLSGDGQNEGIRIDSYGNVGIGTTAPTETLTVVGNVSMNEWLKINSWPGYGTGNASIWYDGVGASGSATGVLNIGGTHNQNHLSVTTAGNVGIGTTDPSAKLDVSGSVRFANNKGYLSYYNVAHYDQVEIGAIGASTSLSLVTNGISQMYVTPAGYVGIGTYAPRSMLDVAGRISNPGMASGSSGYYVCKDGNGELNYGSSCSLSDIRLKENIEILPEALGKILEITPVTWEWRDKQRGEDREMGLIAQNVQKQFPEAVDQNSNGYFNLRYEILVAPLIKAVQEFYHKWLDDKVSKDRKLASLEAENARKEERIQKLEQENAGKSQELEEIKARLDRIEKNLKTK